MVTTVAPSPFDDPAADVVLHSLSDDVYFRVFRSVLSTASPLFKDVFSLPQPSTSESKTEEGIPTIPVQESAKTMDALLRICYPRTVPGINSLDEIEHILEAARKYDMEVVTEYARKRLNAFVETRPVEVYAIACRYELEEEARIAAKYTAQNPIDTILCMSTLEGTLGTSLLSYHWRCDDVAKTVSSQFDRIKDNTMGWLSQCGGREDGWEQEQARAAREDEHVGQTAMAAASPHRGIGAAQSSPIWEDAISCEQYSSCDCKHRWACAELAASECSFSGSVDRMLMDVPVELYT